MPDANRKAYIFPGQGSQKAGMGRDFYDGSALAKKIFDEADEALGFSLSRLIFEGPEKDLRQTINAQPAILTVSYVCLQVALASGGGERIALPEFVAGHSLGEYTALAAAGVLDFSSVVRLARERGRLMHEAGQRTPGAMAAILGMENSLVAEVCKQTGTWMANVNSPGQLVVSGAKEDVEKAAKLAESMGAARSVMLQVSGAFHTPLMQPAVQGMKDAMGGIRFNEARMPLVANTTALPMTGPDEIKEELIRQLCSAVQWQRSVEFMINNGVTTFIEIGPGEVLSGLMRRINRSARALNIGEMGELKNIMG